MKVCFNLDTLSTQGAGLYYATLPLFKELSKLELKMLAVGQELDGKGVDCWNYNDSNNYNASSIFDYISAHKSTDVIHSHGLWGKFSIATSISKKNLIVSPHGMLDSWALNNKKFRKKVALSSYERVNLKKSRFCHALCSQEADSLLKYVEHEKIYIAPNGIESSYIVENKKVLSDKKRFLFLGRLDKKKGLINLIHAWERIIKVHADVELHIAGWGDLHSYLTHNLPENAFYHGSVFGMEKTQLLDHCDFFILPSFSEGLPMTILEAWSRGLVAGYSEFCNFSSELDSGLAFNMSTDIVGIVNCMNQLLELSSEEYSNLSQNSISRVKDNYQWNKISEVHKYHYEKS